MNRSIKNNSPPREIIPVSNLLFGGLLLFFLLEYGRVAHYLPVLEAAKINTIIPVSVFVITFLSNKGRSGSAVLNAVNTKWLLLFLLLFPIQAITADVTLYVYNKFKAIVGYLLIYFVILKQVTSIERIKAIFLGLVFVHLLLLFLNPSLVLAPEGRHYIGGTTFLGDGNDFAWSVCIVLPFALFLFQTSNSKFWRAVYLGSFILLILSVIGTQSRGGSIALGSSMLYLIIREKKKAIWLIGFGSIVILILLFAPQAYFDRMRSVVDYETEGSAQGRIMAWKSAMRMAADNPLTGVGAGHFSVKYGVEYRPPGIGRTEIPWSNAHSIYFMALGEFGFTGAFILLGIILSNLIRNERHLKELKIVASRHNEKFRKMVVAMQASLIAFAVGGAFLSGIYYPHLYIVAALSETTGLFIWCVANSNKIKRQKI